MHTNDSNNWLRWEGYYNSNEPEFQGSGVCSKKKVYWVLSTLAS